MHSLQHSYEQYGQTLLRDGVIFAMHMGQDILMSC